MTKKEAQHLFKKTYLYNEMFGIFYHFTESKEEFIKNDGMDRSAFNS